MRGKIIGVAVAFIIVITAFFAGSLFFLHDIYGRHEKEMAGERAVLLNEITQMTELEEALIKAEEFASFPMTAAGTQRLLLIAYAACVLFTAVVFLFCTVKIIKPFHRLEQFAAEVAKGNLDFPLAIQRENIFGEFSWAFDFMRSELKTSRENEESAKRENKALIAAISHDIKTPVSSIRAYAEGLQKGMDTTPERRERYLSVILKKADEVAKLTDDLFLHALSDMEKLQLEIKPYNAKKLIGGILDPFFAEYGERIRMTEVPDVTVSADEKRLSQVFENIIANAVKYAPGSAVDISFNLEDDLLLCEIRDFGNGIPPRDMPFVWNRFYRGENTEGVSGSGLGLYIVRYIIEKCGGSVRLQNSEKGLRVFFSLLRIS
ncbi:MAG: HAMP domain-containing histidine kinase [Oscillospiraceae bacterium]|nr:HAMP domain-containing histidine kinase [Oscillospiraceae bacterium]